MECSRNCPVGIDVKVYGVNGFGNVPGSSETFRQGAIPGGLVISNNLGATNGNTHTDANSDADTNTDAHSYAHSYANANADSDTDADTANNSVQLSQLQRGRRRRARTHHSDAHRRHFWCGDRGLSNVGH